MHPSSPSPESLPDDLVDPVTAARYLRISKWTIYQWIRRGYIPHYRLGRLIRIREADLASRLEFERQPANVLPDTRS